MALLDGDSSGTKKQQQQPQKRQQRHSRNYKTFKVRVLVLLFIFLALYVGLEVSYGGFLLSYAVEGPPAIDKDHAAFLTSVFWGAFAVGRLLAIPISKFMSPGLQIISDLLLTAISAMGLVISGRKISSILWVCSATLGLGMASIFPSAVNWVEQYVVMTGKSTAILVVAAATGEMAVPIIVGSLFSSTGPICLMYTVLVISLAVVVIFLLLLRLSIGRSTQRRGVDVDAASVAASGFLSDMDTLDGDENQAGSSPSLFQLGKERKQKMNGKNKKVTFQLTDNAKYTRLDG